jgi:AraC-like DNA-binding protein
MAKQHLKEATPSRESSDYTILPLQIYPQIYLNEVFFVSYHWHDEMEIVYIEEGEFIIHVSGAAHHAKMGEVLFINSQEIHQITALTDSSIHHAIVFNPEIIRFEWYDPSQRKYINPLIKGKIKYLFHINDFPDIKNIVVREIKDIVSAYQIAKDSWPIVAKASLLKIIATLINHELLIHISLPEEKDDEKAMIAKAIMTHIHENYMQKLTLDQLANLVNFSTQYFCKFFKLMFGKTAIEYINEYRIQKASQLLTQTNDKIIDIAFSVGFDNFSYFIRKYKSLKGMTPSEYRNIGKVANTK